MAVRTLGWSASIASERLSIAIAFVTSFSRVYDSPNAFSKSVRSPELSPCLLEPGDREARLPGLEVEDRQLHPRGPARARVLAACSSSRLAPGMSPLRRSSRAVDPRISVVRVDREGHGRSSSSAASLSPSDRARPARLLSGDAYSRIGVHRTPPQGARFPRWFRSRSTARPGCSSRRRSSAPWQARPSVQIDRAVDLSPVLTEQRQIVVGPPRSTGRPRSPPDTSARASFRAALFRARFPRLFRGSAALASSRASFGVLGRGSSSWPRLSRTSPRELRHLGGAALPWSAPSADLASAPARSPSSI